MTIEALIESGVQLAKDEFLDELDEETMRKFLTMYFLKVPITGIAVIQAASPPVKAARTKQEVPLEEQCGVPQGNGIPCPIRKRKDMKTCGRHIGKENVVRCNKLVTRRDKSITPCGAKALDGTTRCKDHPEKTSSEERPICMGKAGGDKPRACKARATKGSKYCHVHQNQDPDKEPSEAEDEAEEEVEAEPEVETVQICGRKNPKSGAVCKREVTKNGRCDFHQE